MHPARKRLALPVKASAVTAAAVAAMFAAPAAHAASSSATSSSTYVARTVWAGKCEAILYGNTANQVSAGIYMSLSPESTIRCVGWLERSNDPSPGWHMIAGYYDFRTPGTTAYSGWYADVYPEWARACVEAHMLDGSVSMGCTKAY
jgi:hypothetical protein